VDRYVDLVFLGEDGNPRLARCGLLFLDLLGVTEMARSPSAEQNLVELERAIRSLGLRDFFDPDSAWTAAVVRRKKKPRPRNQHSPAPLGASGKNTSAAWVGQTPRAAMEVTSTPSGRV
jgi:hypothetical protein